jgi:hypothetical protein
MIRHYVNILDNLITESRGLGARRSGEEFISTTNPNEKIYVDSVRFYPETTTEFSSYEEMIDDLKKRVNNISGANVNLIGNFKQTDRAYGIAIFDNPQGSKLVFVKPYRSIKLDPTQNQWNNQTGIPGFKYNSKSAAKTQAGLTPQDILTKQSDLQPADIVKQVSEKFGANSPLTKVTRDIARGVRLPITIDAPPGISFTAFRDYFCELLHPIALQTGNYRGNAGQAAMKFLDRGGFEDTTINFGTDKTEGLSDSILISDDGKKIKVSSKGAGGAQASAKNLLDAVNELRSTNPALAKKHAEIIDVIQEMVSAGQSGAPLVLGIKYNIIDSGDADVIKSLKGQARVNLASVENMSLSAKLKKLILERKPDDPQNVNLYFHALAAVAHKVANHVNSKTNFGGAASEILNNGALIQVYTTASENGEKWTIEKFNTKWPSDTVTDVKFSASKTYYSTGIKGNFTFKILENNAADIEDNTDKIAELPSEPAYKRPEDIEDITYGVKGITAKSYKRGGADSEIKSAPRQRR